MADTLEDEIWDGFKDDMRPRGEVFMREEPTRWTEVKESENQRDWIWEGYIAKGHTTLLSALWKAGKSTFLRCLFVAMHNQEEFAGQPTTKAKVLVVSEEAIDDWAINREDLDDEEIEDIYVWSRPIRMKPNLKQWSQAINEILAQCKHYDIDCVIFDTISTFWPIDNENDSAQVLKALVPLYALTEANIAVVLVHHFRKGGGDQGQASRGSGALPGFVDNIIEFTRSDDGYANDRVLKTYGRFDEVIPEVLIRYSLEGKYITIGDKISYSKITRTNRILEILEQSKAPLSGKEIYNIWAIGGVSISLRSVQRYVKDLVAVGDIKVAEEKTVAGKIVPFYCLARAYDGQIGINFSTHDKISDPSHCDLSQQDLSRDSHDKNATRDTGTLSQVNDNLPGETTRDTTGHNPKTNGFVAAPFPNLYPYTEDNPKGGE